MSEGRAFLDTNVVAYLFSEDEPDKRQRSISAVNSYDCQISTQVLKDVYRAIGKICAYGRLWIVDIETVKHAIQLHERYAYAYYDCLIISSALACNCQYLITEDMSDGQLIESRLTISNIYSKL
jgi:predicted nucleic acid-binding protein